MSAQSGWGWSGIAIACLAACGGGGSEPSGAPDAFPSAAFATVVGARGAIQAEVRTSPTQPPTHGVLSVELTLRDAASGAPLDGLTVDVQPWMTAMGHGSSVKPTVTGGGAGHYVATNVNLFMPGRWELRTTVTGAVEDTLAPVLDVP